ncbi:TIGR03084 family metal-binding protein [Novosphingobium pentaromativorans]|uniref:Mycothiol-dependent maleylpyruvate isomerase metal-binding domain-containing protein n=1 Tax=Novosphingobium pentaromativorans US6-1 TaxID=1088721 RepID=G6ECH3_9SPHN|nr:TIGR03084 family metal-binding protein [Novosphingobium pentaromativorans]AIT80054.1 hypothetical protein JI59_09865 [Novosphingobium pentaromativorans US6-1]EHJ60884.1 hypothetical protein NSU_2044 [Novosphingobium pentaromativorans US6-1]
MTKRAAIEALCDDLLAECRELDRFVSALSDEDWTAVTPFFAWTVRDQILHLHQVDRFGLVSLAGADDFRALVTEVRARQAEGLELSEQVRREFAGSSHAKVLETWRQGYERICAELRAAADGYRIAWFGPEMGIASFATARLMEVWAHGQDIYDLFGVKREPTDRIRHICEIGVRTFGWSFRNRGLEVPKRPQVMLVAPSGEELRWDGESDEVVSGPALDFAMVVTQRRSPQDTRLVASGPAASQWLDIAQCFAGPPQTPAATGSRPPI